MTPNLISFIIPFKYTKERLTLLLTCINNLNTYINSKPDNFEFEICIHETGERSWFPTSQFPNIKHAFTQYRWAFHRAWVLNYGVKHLSTGNLLVLMDGDLLLNQAWFDNLYNNYNYLLDKFTAAWSQIVYLKPDQSIPLTETFTKENFKIARPDIRRSIGGVTIIPRNIFYAVKGIPEDFRGTWGGEDNAFVLKIIHHKYKINYFNNTQLYHLYHQQTTPRIGRTRSKYTVMQTWDTKKWKKYTDAVTEWGEDPDCDLVDFKKL